ncbi:DUF6444 domain-containing protein [Pseudofrankia sp. DC12]|uniref:DUF6444 domain-containing protein n=1 Tax=Pseudofrankia sp. DC12 TaxID=683315 RepID=UPI0012F88C17
MGRPSYDELAALVVAQATIIADQAARIEVLKSQVEALTGRIAELEARLAATSKNWSRTPSSDGSRCGAGSGCIGRRSGDGRASGGRSGWADTHPLGWLMADGR